jgi:hypothetical protein
MTALPDRSKPMAMPWSPEPFGSTVPPINVEYIMDEPSALSLMTKASVPYGVRSYAPAVVGKVGSSVKPVTNAQPEESTAMSYPDSWAPPASGPPRYVEYTSDEPEASSFVTKMSLQYDLGL